ncbi:hypothetical protein GIS00_15000 [Nakamurella sp. YIM 132087]|uniref:Uncharacterized protein n=1 Tax=Nakamurella alba TaxID=2665158 RepID=A0A7K1FMA6_9ACTN|nr:hypothetical protein [Nakamurella alba]MTD15248.1 hypothetical protein [Nakamurella alba]
MRRTLTTRFVIAMSLLVLLCCVGWALLAQHVVPDACSYADPPPRAQYLHCP